MEVYGADEVCAGVVRDLWIDRAEPQIRYLEVDIDTRHVLLPINFAKIDGRNRIVTVKSIQSSQFAMVPSLDNPNQVTRREEDQILAYYASGHLYGYPSTQRALDMSHDDFSFEPRRGLPALLPEGERLLWQGSPRWQSLAVRAYQVRKVAVYFGILVAWRIAAGVNAGHSFATVGSVLPVHPAARRHRLRRAVRPRLSQRPIHGLQHHEQTVFLSGMASRSN